MPHVVRAKLLVGEPVLDYVASDGEYLRSVWEDVGGFLDVAMKEHAKDES